MTGRLAPTPSGRMHLGNLFSALLCWLSTRAQNGRLILRVEDLDPQRARAAYAGQILEDLAWLGLDWDEGPAAPSQAGADAAAQPGPHAPYCQSARTVFYRECLRTLDEMGLVYPCYCNRAELHAAEAPHLSDGTYRYSGRCYALSSDEHAALAKTRRAALRAHVPDETVALTDICRGPYSQNLARDCGDFILCRSDGVFAYQLATSADDGAMGVTEVVRGADLLSSAPRQIWLMRQLGYTPPRYCHVPLLLAPDGRRLSKRDKDLDVGFLRSRLARPEPLVGALAALAGLIDRPEPLPAAALVPLFHWSRVKKSDITLDIPGFLSALGPFFGN